VDYVNNIAFETVTGSVKDKTWNVADFVVIVTAKGIERPLFIYEWDFRDRSGGMITKGK